MISRRARLWAAVIVLPLSLLAQESKPPKKKSSKKKESSRPASDVRFVMGRRPSLRFGDLFRMDFRIKLQSDFRQFQPDMETDDGLFDMRRKRVGVEGTFLRDFEYEVEGELGVERNQFRDAYVNYRRFRDFQLRVGKFKVPFSQDQLTGPTAMDFVFRSLLAENLSPNRDVGLMLHGRFFQRGLGYQAAVFRKDGDNARAAGDVSTGRATLVGRVVGKPLRLAPAPKLVRELEVGAAVTASDVEEGDFGLRGRTHSRETFFSRRPVNGLRLRLGAELNWMPGPFSVKAEAAQVTQERERLSVRQEDLPDLVARSWYLSGTWVVTGEPKADGVEPRKAFLAGGVGAVEVGARMESLRFGSRGSSGLPSLSPRAANVAGNSDRAWTFGVNWYWNRYAKIQYNAIREKIEDPQRAPVAGGSIFWIQVWRLQFVM